MIREINLFSKILKFSICNIFYLSINVYLYLSINYLFICTDLLNLLIKEL